ncbi:MAG: hypothetical protein ACYC4L_06705 [Chloroflexota bacterium]
MQDLVNAAKTLSVPFELSADGTFVSFAGKGEVVYIVRNAWRGGYTVHVASAEGRNQVGHYEEAEEAVAAASELLARPYFAGPVIGSVARPQRKAS